MVFLRMDGLAWELICHHKIKSDGGMVYVTMRICCVDVRVHIYVIIYSVG